MEFKVPLWKHQLDAFERFKNMNEGFLFFEVGTGKTATTINILRYKYFQKKRILRTIIITPLVTLPNWKREWLVHSHVKEEDIIILQGSGAKRLQQLNQLAFNEKGERLNKIIIIAYECLLMPAVFERLRDFSAECLVFDEIHRVKNLQAKRSKKAVELARLPQVKIGLTGTPILNSIMDIFMPFKVIVGSKAFSYNFYAFRNEYFQDLNAMMPSSKYFPKWVIRPEKQLEINERITPYVCLAKKNECLDLPPYIRVLRYVELSDEQKKIYAEMKKNFLTFVKGEAVSAQLAITKALRLQQIASGFAKTEDGVELGFDDNSRKDMLEELLEQITPNHKVIVWAVFKQNYTSIASVCEKLKLKFVELHGEVPQSERQKAVDQFETDPETKVFIGHPGSGGIGINLISASYSIFYSRSFSLEHDLQAEARNYRGGSEIHKTITRIDIVARGTIDEVVAEALAKKEEIGNKMLEHVAHRLEELEN